MTARGGHRLFVAIDPPAGVAAQLASWARAVRPLGVRPLPPENVHLTLAFLGHRPGGEVDAVLGGIEDAVHEFTLGGPRGPLALTTTTPAWLPPRRPRALAVDLEDPSGQLAELRGSVAAAMERAIGWRDERPRFRPHLTAGRLSAPPERGALPPTPALAFTVDRVSVYRSFLEPGGARYERLGSTLLA